jgi:hypothetical protein
MLHTPGFHLADVVTAGLGRLSNGFERGLCRAQLRTAVTEIRVRKSKSPPGWNNGLQKQMEYE